MKSYKFRIYPNKQQQIQMQRFELIIRRVWNYFLSLNEKLYDQTKTFKFYNEMSKELTHMKNTQMYSWYNDCPAVSLQRTLRNLSEALPSKKRPDLKSPKFKSKHTNKLSFYVSNQAFSIDDKYIKIPKVGRIKYIDSRRITGKIMNATVSRDGDRWFCSIAVEHANMPKVPRNANNAVGIDLGISTLIITSDDEKIGNPRPLKKSSKRLKRLQRKLQKCKLGSRNRAKRKLRLKKKHMEVKNQRNYYIHKITTHLVRKYDVICTEDLDVKGMKEQPNKLSRSLQDVCFAEIIRQLRYKCEWYGKHFVQIGRWDASTKKCSKCGNKKKVMPLNVRTYKCEKCKLVMDRDLNASINIRNWGLRKCVGVVNSERSSSNWILRLWRYICIGESGRKCTWLVKYIKPKI